MKKYIIISVLLLFLVNLSHSQHRYDVEISEGFIFFDYFNSYPKGNEDAFYGYGLQTDFVIWNHFYKTKNLIFKIGGGYTNFYYLDYGRFFVDGIEDVSYTSYINLKICMKLKPHWSPIGYLIKSSNYILFHKQLQSHLQNRIFNTVDIGIDINIYKSIYLNLSSPITIHPMQSGLYWYSNPPKGGLFKPWVGISGLNLGISYGFGHIYQD